MLYVASTSPQTRNFLSVAFGSSFNFVDLTPPGGLAPSPAATFAQYNNLVIYADGNNNTLYAGVGASTPFATLTGPFGNAPSGLCVGVIGQFVVIANLAPGNATTLQWSGINQPFNWPTPGSADAIAQQAGLQVMDYTLGPILGVSQGDQWGLIIQQNGLSRVQYIGGQAVFQFNEIYRGPSCIGPLSWVKFGGRIYLCAGDGFLVTDGVTVQRIGDARVDRWFQAHWGISITDVFTGTANVSCGVDAQRKLIFWTFPLLGTGTAPNAWIAYNYSENRWTHGTDGIQCFVKTEDVYEFTPNFGLQAFSSSAAPQGGGFGGTLTGTPQVAVLTSAETELNPGGRALLQGFRPQVSGIPAGGMTVRIGSRSRLGDQVSFTPALQLNGITNFADTFVDDNYHRAEVTLNGAFTQAIGGEFKAVPSGEF